MFEIGDKVVIQTLKPAMVGKIVLWYYDEGNVWVVECDGWRFDCCESELSRV